MCAPTPHLSLNTATRDAADNDRRIEALYRLAKELKEAEAVRDSRLNAPETSSQLTLP